MNFQFSSLTKFLISFLLIFSGCSSKYEYLQNENQLEVLNFIMNDTKHGVLKKTIPYDAISRYNVNTEAFNYWNPCKIYLENDSAVLTEKEIDFLNQELRKSKAEKIKIKSSNIKSKNNADKIRTQAITIPILFRNDNYAIYYSDQRYGAQMNLLRKKNDKWERYCSYTVWIE